MELRLLSILWVVFIVAKVALSSSMKFTKPIKPEEMLSEILLTANSFILCLTIFVALPSVSLAENWDFYGHHFYTPDPNFSISRIEAAIAYSRSLDKIPNLPPDGDSYDDSSQTLPPEIIHYFKSIEKYFFSRTDQISLHTCKGCYGGMIPETKSIFLDIDFLSKVKEENGEKAYRQTYQVIIAHELGHFVQDIWTQKYGTSPNYTSGESNYKKPDDTASVIFNLREIALSALAHAEVDMIGFKALSDLGHEFPESGFRVIQELLLKCSNKLGRSYRSFHYYSQYVLRTKVGELSNKMMFNGHDQFLSEGLSRSKAAQ